jgi:hypothetical protein
MDNLLHIIGKELAADLRDEMPECLVTAHPAGEHCCTLVVKLKKDKKRSNKYQIRDRLISFGGSLSGRRSLDLGPTEYQITLQYQPKQLTAMINANITRIVFDVAQPDSIEKVSNWIKNENLPAGR